MRQSEKVAALVERMPELDKEGKLTGPDWPAMEKVCDGILEGGREGILELVRLLREVDDGQDYKARYVLHGLAVHVGKPGKEAARRLFAETLSSQLDGDRPKAVRGLLVRQLQVAGGREAVPALGKALADEELCDDAAHALLAIREGALEQFRKALPGAAGRRRLAVLQALGILVDAGSIPSLREAAADGDRDVRLTALWALARIGDAGAVELMTKAADAAPGWERIKAASACLLLADNLLAAGRKAEAARLYRHLVRTREDASEEYLREIAEKGLEVASR